MKRIVIAGAGTAGTTAAAALRQAGFEGRIFLIGHEAALPYQRPPLSKTWLTAAEQPRPSLLKPGTFFAENDIDLMQARKVVGIERKAACIRFADGDSLDYDALILATGAAPRRLDLAGSDAAGIHYLRNLDDAAALRHDLHRPETGTVAIIGAGVIGMEVAAAAVAAGKKAIVIEAAARPMARVASPATTNFVVERLRAEGVEFLFNRQVAGFETAGGHVAAVTLGDGQSVPADLVLVAIGAVPNDELARKAGLECDDGVCVDENMRSTDPSIMAIGDCARAPNPFAGGMVRLETVHNAMTQAQIAAAALCGTPKPAPVAPRFWSDIDGMKVQVLGIARSYDLVRCPTSDPEKLQQEVHLLEGERLAAAETINLPRRQSALAKEIGPVK